MARFSELINREATTGYRVVDQRGADDAAMNEPSGIDCDEVFVLIGGGSTGLEQLILKLIRQGKRVHLVPGIFDATLFRQTLNDLAGVPVLSVGGCGLSQLEAATKRLFDIVGSAVLMLIFAPVLPVVALLVKLAAPGTLLFSQERLGEGGRRFRIYKFRTMYEDAENVLGSDRSFTRYTLRTTINFLEEKTRELHLWVAFCELLASTSYLSS